MTNRSASATEQNHFSPLMRHPSTTAGSGTARATLAPTSDPPCTSVRNCAGAQARRVVTGVQGGQEAVPQGLAAPVLEGADGTGRAHDGAGVAALAGVGQQVERALSSNGPGPSRPPDSIPDAQMARPATS